MHSDKICYRINHKTTQDKYHCKSFYCLTLVSLAPGPDVFFFVFEISSILQLLGDRIGRIDDRFAAIHGDVQLFLLVVKHWRWLFFPAFVEQQPFDVAVGCLE